jgi:hypothetical protein
MNMLIQILEVMIDRQCCDATIRRIFIILWAILTLLAL